MSCAACQQKVEKAVSRLDGVTSCSVSLLTNSMAVDGSAAPKEIIKAVEAAGYGASPLVAANKAAGSMSAKIAAEEEMLADKTTPLMKKRLIASIVFLLALMYFSMGVHMWNWPVPPFMRGNHVAMGLMQLLLSGIIMVINQKFFISGFRSLFHGSPNMDSTIALGSAAAFAYSTVMLFAMTTAQMKGGSAAAAPYMNEFYFESAGMILTLITIGKTLEAYSKGRTTDALKSLMKLAPKTANLLRDGKEVTVNIDEVQAGDVFLVRPGENIPVDGIVLEGSSAVNESALTGESIPADKAPGSHVSSATFNQSGLLKCRATRVGEDTTLAQIITMVSDAAATKAPVAKLADKISGIFVPAVIALAAITLVIWLLAGADVGFALARSICVLVVSCPCALGLATPVAIMVGNGLGAKNGILFKTAQSLQETGSMQIIALDKTGTITSGEPKVTDLLPADGVSEEQLVTLAAALEAGSEHPLAKAVTAYAAQQNAGIGSANSEAAIASTETAGASLDASSIVVKDFLALPGNGLQGTVDGRKMIAGSAKFISGKITVSEEMQSRAAAFAADGKTPLFFAADGKFLGMIAVADTMKEDSAQAISELQKMGIHVVMLTGDNKRTAEAIGRAAGVNEVVAGVLPEGKEAIIRKLQEKGKVAMVGDGINDAPALTRADIGIAIGAGTDVAIDAADVVLMKSRLTDVSAAVRLSRATYRNIVENLFWALFYNVLLIPLAAGAYQHLFGLTMNPMWGAAAMSCSSIFVVGNALRLNLFRLHDASKDRPQVHPVVADAGGFVLEQNDQKDIESGKDVIMTKTIKIEGMMCNHCEATVKKALESLDGVESAAVSHEAGTAVVELSKEVADTELTKAVEDKDYKVTGIQ